MSFISILIASHSQLQVGLSTTGVPKLARRGRGRSDQSMRSLRKSCSTCGLVRRWPRARHDPHRRQSRFLIRRFEDGYVKRCAAGEASSRSDHIPSVRIECARCGDARPFATGKSGGLPVQNPDPQALFGQVPRVASDRPVACRRRSGTNDKRATVVCSAAVPLAGERLAGCHWQAWLPAARAPCPATEEAGILRGSGTSLTSVFRVARRAGERNAVGYVRPPTLTRRAPSRPILMSCGSAGPIDIIELALP
jgi:RNase P subunit RPR2